MAEGERGDQSFEVASFGLAGQGFADFFDGWVFGIDWGVAEVVKRDA